jgi:hypothetical protein
MRVAVVRKDNTPRDPTRDASREAIRAAAAAQDKLERTGRRSSVPARWLQRAALG